MRQQIEKLALSNRIPFQREVMISLSTTVTPIPFANVGVLTASIFFPLRYSHSAVEVADLEDIRMTADLLEQAVRTPWLGLTFFFFSQILKGTGYELTILDQIFKIR